MWSKFLTPVLTAISIWLVATAALAFPLTATSIGRLEGNVARADLPVVEVNERILIRRPAGASNQKQRMTSPRPAPQALQRSTGSKAVPRQPLLNTQRNLSPGVNQRKNPISTAKRPGTRSDTAGKTTSKNTAAELLRDIIRGKPTASKPAGRNAEKSKQAPPARSPKREAIGRKPPQPTKIDKASGRADKAVSPGVVTTKAPVPLPRPSTEAGDRVLPELAERGASSEESAGSETNQRAGDRADAASGAAQSSAKDGQGQADRVASDQQQETSGDKTQSRSATENPRAALVGDMAAMGIGDDIQKAALEIFAKDPTEKGREEATSVAVAAQYGIPLDAAKKAWSKAEGKPLTADKLIDLIGTTALLGDLDSVERMKDDAYWDRVAEKGVDQVIKDSIREVFEIPDKAIEDPQLSASDIISLIGKTASVGDLDAVDRMKDEAYWDRVKEKGLDQAVKDSIGLTQGLPQELVEDGDISPSELLDIAAKIQGAKAKPDQELVRGAPVGMVQGDAPQDAPNEGANAPNKGPQDDIDLSNAVRGGALVQDEGESGDKSRGSGSPPNEETVGAGAPGSGQSGIGSSDTAQGFGAGTETPPGEEPERSGSWVTVTHNEDGSFTLSHGTYLDDGSHYQHDSETYSQSEDGTWVNQRGDEYKDTSGTGGPPPEGSYVTEYNEDGSYTIYDNSDDGSTSAQSSGSDSDSSSDSGESSNDGCADGQQSCGNQSAGGAESDTASEDPATQETAKGEPLPDGPGSGGEQLIPLEHVTGGKMGRDQSNTLRRGIGVARGGGLINPVDERANSSGPMTAEEAKLGLIAIGVASGSGVDAPDRGRNTYVPTEQELRDALIRAGGGYTDPSDDAGDTPGSVNPVLPSVGPAGPGPVATQSNIGQAKRIVDNAGTLLSIIDSLGSAQR